MTVLQPEIWGDTSPCGYAIAKFHEKLIRHCWQYGNNIEATSDFVERIVRLVAFDILTTA